MQAFGFLTPLFNKAAGKLKLISRIVLLVGVGLSVLFAIINFVQAGIAGGNGPGSNNISDYAGYAKSMAHYSYLAGLGTLHFVWMGFLSLTVGSGISFIAALSLHVLSGLADKFVEDEEVPVRPVYTATAQQAAPVQQQAPVQQAQSFCDNCGAPIAPGTTFCGSCGKKMG